MSEQIPREPVIPCATIKVLTGCGSMYVRVGFQDGKPIEVFITRGHTGHCAGCFNEAIGRAISVGLQYGAPVEAYIKTLRGITCDKPLMFPKEERCSSCADGIASGISKVISEFQQGEGNEKQNDHSPVLPDDNGDVLRNSVCND